MLFNSFVFIVLVAVTFLLYYLPRFSRFQVQILILASMVFYAWHKPILLILLLTSAGINIITSYYVTYGNEKYRKLIASLGVASNLLVLALFKYGGLIAITFFEDGSISNFLISIPLPIGISFFTFQGISLMVDVYKENYFKGKELIPKSLLEHAKKILFFIAYFPQLVAGPIVKAHDFLPQIGVKTINDILWKKSFKSIVLGYFLKMVVADNLKDFTYWIAYPYFEAYDTSSLLVMLYGFSCQIFADFAGYSLIAIGIAGLFGYNLRDNFKYPYISSSFREFWKRWHISLSSFLQEYLYIPLGGNRKGKYRTYINLMITMILGGLWHGAAWSYAVWGTFHGFALAIERIFMQKFTLRKHALVLVIKGMFVFIMVTLAWLLFQLPDFSHVIKYFEAIGNNTSIRINYKLIIQILVYSSPIVLYHIVYLIKQGKYRKLVYKLEYIAYGLFIFFIITNSGIPGEFIYFQF